MLDLNQIIEVAGKTARAVAPSDPYRRNEIFSQVRAALLSANHGEVGEATKCFREMYKSNMKKVKK